MKIPPIRARIANIYFLKIYTIICFSVNNIDILFFILYLIMNLTQLNAKRLTQEELIEFVRLLTDSAKNKQLEDPIALKYLETIEKDAAELENANKAVLSDDKNKLLADLDRQRDKHLLIFRRLMQVHELSDDNSPEAVAYEKLNDLWTKKYETLPYLNLAVETTGIEDLLFDLSTNKFADDIETLNLSDAVENIKISNDKFKIIYSELAAGKDSLKPNYDSRSLRIELTETVVLYMNYVQTLAEASAGKEMTALNNSIKDVSKTYFQQIAERHSGVPIAE